MNENDVKRIIRDEEFKCWVNKQTKEIEERQRRIELRNTNKKMVFFAMGAFTGLVMALVLLMPYTYGVW